MIPDRDCLRRDGRNADDGGGYAASSSGDSRALDGNRRSPVLKVGHRCLGGRDCGRLVQYPRRKNKVARRLARYLGIALLAVDIRADDNIAGATAFTLASTSVVTFTSAIISTIVCV